MPAMLVTPKGNEVGRGDPGWQYWKFVWRSTMIAVVTLQDHLHFAHFRIANVLATVSRQTLPGKHPLRRLLAIFTYGTIMVNYRSLFSLQTDRSGLARALPFADFGEVNDAAVRLLETPREVALPFHNNTRFAGMPAALQAAP